MCPFGLFNDFTHISCIPWVWNALFGLFWIECSLMCVWPAPVFRRLRRIRIRKWCINHKCTMNELPYGLSRRHTLNSRHLSKIFGSCLKFTEYSDSFRTVSSFGWLKFTWTTDSVAYALFSEQWKCAANAWMARWCCCDYTDRLVSYETWKHMQNNDTNNTNITWKSLLECCSTTTIYQTISPKFTVSLLTCGRIHPHFVWKSNARVNNYYSTASRLCIRSTHSCSSVSVRVHQTNLADRLTKKRLSIKIEGFWEGDRSGFHSLSYLWIWIFSENYKTRTVEENQ